MHRQIDRQNSFALYGNSAKRQMAANFGQKIGTQQPVQINALKQRVVEANHTTENFHAREPNDTHLMKARPSTSTRLAQKSQVFGPGQQ